MFPGRGQGDGAAAGAAGPGRRVPDRADLLRPDACQHRLPEEALPLVERFADVFAPYDAVVTPSGSCVGSVRHQHAMIAKRSGSPGLVEQVEAVAAKTYELSEFLVDVLGVTDVGAYFPHRVTYHPTCHSLRMLRRRRPAAPAAAGRRGLRAGRAAGAEECCGFGGTFAIKNADTSTAMLADKVRHVLDTGRRGLHRRRQLLPDAHRRRPVPVRAGAKTVHLAQILAAHSREGSGAVERRR